VKRSKAEMPFRVAVLPDSFSEAMPSALQVAPSSVDLKNSRSGSDRPLSSSARYSRVRVAERPALFCEGEMST
jgi:hypothetical protein